MVQPEYQALLEKSRNIVIGTPRNILRKYFGYGKDDPLPEEFRLDDSPKAFILPKHLWKDFDDTTGTTANTAGDKERDKRRSFKSSKEPTISRKSSVVRRELKQAKEIFGVELESKRSAEKRNKKVAERNLLDFFKEKEELEPEAPLTRIDGRAGRWEPGYYHRDPKYYEKDRTKCERKKRRESAFDEEAPRKRESLYQIICGSGSSSGSNPVEKEDSEEEQMPVYETRLTDHHHSLPTIVENKERPKPQGRRMSSVPNFAHRDGSDLSINMDPYPMDRIARDNNLKYYRSYPMYPTLSNERFFEWYKDLRRLQDPLAKQDELKKKRRSKSLDDADISLSRYPRTRTSGDSGSTDRPTRSDRTSYTYHHSDGKPERKDYSIKDYIYDNARSIAIMPPRRPVPRYVDDRKGTTHLLEPSGLLHRYVHKDEFGKIPYYLRWRNEELGRPSDPDFDKFYSFHRCKFQYGHIHCKHCNRAYPTCGHREGWEWDGEGNCCSEYGDCPYCCRDENYTGSQQRHSYSESRSRGRKTYSKGYSYGSGAGEGPSTRSDIYTVEQTSDAQCGDSEAISKSDLETVLKKYCDAIKDPPKPKYSTDGKCSDKDRGVHYVVNRMHQLMVEEEKRKRDNEVKQLFLRMIKSQEMKSCSALLESCQNFRRASNNSNYFNMGTCTSPTISSNSSSSSDNWDCCHPNYFNCCYYCCYY